MSTYAGILTRLDLTNTMIDYLKIDIEGDEIHFFEEIFTVSFQYLRNIKQIGMEIHLPTISMHEKIDFCYTENDYFFSV